MAHLSWLCGRETDEPLRSSLRGTITETIYVMLFVKSIVLGVFVLVSIVPATSIRVAAQSTLFNIPSTDVLAKKKVYLEFDFISHFESHDKGGFQGYVPRTVVGVGKRTEVGLNASFIDAYSPDQPVELQPNVKHQFYQNEGNGVTVSGGGILYLPVTHRTGTDTFGMIYTVVSKQVKASHGPRFTGGAYGLVGRVSGSGSTGGAIVGYEQPLAPGKVSFVADWFSGKNRFGYVTPGLSFTVSKSSVLYAGYSVGNQGRKNNALFVYYGITF